MTCKKQKTKANGMQFKEASIKKHGFPPTKSGLQIYKTKMVDRLVLRTPN